jgi:signal transduction histidine kinase
MSEDDRHGKADHTHGPEERHGKADHEHEPEEGHGEPDHEHGRPGDERRYDRQGVRAGTWVNRAVLALVLVALAYVAYAVSAAFFPRWWAQQVAGQVDGQLSAGTLWGLFYGFVFTFVPLLVIAQMRRGFLSWTWRIIILVVAVLLAVPNWLTLSVVAGNSKAAHAGERIFDVDAPGFRAATGIGAIVGGVVALVLVAASIRLARRRRQVKELKGQLSEREQVERDRELDEREHERRDGG